eukprot:2476840-Pyramimonas_sp.AAC.1
MVRVRASVVQRLSSARPSDDGATLSGRFRLQRLSQRVLAASGIVYVLAASGIVYGFRTLSALVRAALPSRVHQRQRHRHQRHRHRHHRHHHFLTIHSQTKLLPKTSSIFRRH